MDTNALWAPDRNNSTTASVTAGSTITKSSPPILPSDLFKSIASDYLRDNCYGITIEEVIDLIKQHQPERLL